MSDAYAQIDAVNWSRLKLMRISPLHYLHGVGRTDTDALRRGRAAHLAILEPEKYATSVALWPDGRRRTGRVWKEFLAANHDRIIITESVSKCIDGMATSVRRHPVAVPILEIGTAEKVVVWTDVATGIPCKARLDWVAVSADSAIVVDLKTARHAVDTRAISGEAYRLGYFGQLAFYRRALRSLSAAPSRAVIIAVEPHPPHDVAVYEIDEDSLASCDVEIDGLLARLKTCIDSDNWPGAAADVRKLEIPNWAWVGDGDGEVSDPEWIS